MKYLKNIYKRLALFFLSFFLFLNKLIFTHVADEHVASSTGSRLFFL